MGNRRKYSRASGPVAPRARAWASVPVGGSAIDCKQDWLYDRKLPRQRGQLRSRRNRGKGDGTRRGRYREGDSDTAQTIRPALFWSAGRIVSSQSKPPRSASIRNTPAPPNQQESLRSFLFLPYLSPIISCRVVIRSIRSFRVIFGSRSSNSWPTRFPRRDFPRAEAMEICPVSRSMKSPKTSV